VGSRWDGPWKGFRHELLATLACARQVWRLVPGRRRWALGTAALVIALTSVCQVAMPLFLGRLIDRVQHGLEQGLPRADLYLLAGWNLAAIAGAYLLREALHVVRRYLVEGTCLHLEKETAVRLVGHLLKVGLEALAQQRVGALHGRIHRSVDGFVRFLRLMFLDFFPAVLTGLFALATAVAKQPALGVVMAGVIPVALFLTVWQILSQKGVHLALLHGKEAMDGTVVEQLGGLDYVRAAHTHQREVERVARAAEERRAREFRHHFRMSLFGGAKALNEAFFHVLVLGVAVYCAAAGSLSFGDVWTFSLLFLNVMTPLSEIHRVVVEGHESSLRVGQLLELLAEPADPSFEPAVVREPCLDAGAPVVVAENLRVEYGTGQGKRKRALQGASLTLRHGETIGVAGRSGCGKTTWLRVLLRLTHPSGGKVWLGGVPLESVSREAIGRLVGYVGQSPFVFAGTIAENIAYGTDKASAADIRRAAELACVHEEILALPGGYQAPVAERGQNLSGGQRQRLALARAFLKDPPILILDEATSALDTVSERKVQQALGQARRDRTVILVAHRLSTLRHADRIVVFEGGRIAEVGTYHELAQRGGLFTELMRCAGDLRGCGGHPEAAEAAAQRGFRSSA
jgi:ATP-binding cassette subfamily B protein